MEHHIKPNHDTKTLIDITPQVAGWKYLSFKVMTLKAGEKFQHTTNGEEVALVPLKGEMRIEVDKERFEIGRKNFFTELPYVLYAPPRKTINVEAVTDVEFAIGGAPAEGKYPTRLFAPSEMKAEVRGGGAARRQVTHILQHPLPAERLILFEVYVPGGAWSGWPPHCHDGYMGSPYLEEVYYYRIEPGNGFAIHRNYRKDKSFDELFTVQSGDAVLVTQGFHPVAAAPGSNVYFLNYLAGDLLNEARATPPFDDPDYAWIKDRWEENLLKLPIQKPKHE
ncbi:MAG: 5-deoxy-glucuronate isomerase [Chloroflexi bacterium]|nr:5-deoxy-glucuronate isomerase [Chloroflexota bacterium]